jgi:fibro-slime domain-containing protein
MNHWLKGLLRSPIGRALAVAALLVAAVRLAKWADPLPEGLRATYFSDTEWAMPVRSTLDSTPSTEALVADWEGRPPERFSAIWTGAFVIIRGGTFTFATASDDGSWVFIDEHLVVDNGGSHSTRLASGSVALAPGVHRIVVKYYQSGAQLDMNLLWGAGTSALEPMPPWAMFPRPRHASRLVASLVVRRAVRTPERLWAGTLFIIACAASVGRVWRLIQAIGRERSRFAPLAGIVTASVLLNITGILWGLPASWAGDEITPDAVFLGMARAFSHGWWNRYPPLGFYVLSALFRPWLWLKSAGLIHPSESLEYGALLLLSRLASTAAAIGVLVALYRCGEIVFNRRAGLFAAAAMAVVCPFVYYAKTANPEAPYVFWFAVSLVFFLRSLRTFTFRDAVLFGAAAAAAVCTKDQAYGLYLGAPVAFIYVIWRANAEAGVRRPLLSAVLDRRLILAGLTTTAIFLAMENVAFNPSGFVAHIRDVTGPGQEGYQIVQRTVDGQLTLLGLSVELDRRSWGWPLWILTISGWVLATMDRRSRRVAIALTLIVIGYYLACMNAILYVYDRYLLPVCVVQALFAGFALDASLRAADRHRRSWSVGIIVATFAYTLLYAATVDVLMIRDSRYTVEQCLRAHDTDRGLVGTAFPPTVLPRLDDFRSIEIRTVDDLRDVSPSYYVLNADYARCVEKDSDLGQLVAALQQQSVGYRRVFSYRSPAPWPWLPAGHSDLVGPRLETRVFSTLRSLNPEIEIYQRAP